MYAIWDNANLLLFLTNEEEQKVEEIKQKGRDGTATKEEIEYATRLIEKNSEKLDTNLSPDEFARQYKEFLKEMEKKDKDDLL